MRCKRSGCQNDVTREKMVYCSEACAPLSRIPSTAPSAKEVKARLADPVPRPIGESLRKLATADPKNFKKTELKSVPLSGQEIARFQRRARHVASRRGYPELADDFAQEVFVAFSRGRSATIDQLFIDFLRNEYGSSRTPGGRARASARLRTISLDEPAGKETGSDLNHEIVGSPEPNSDAFCDLGRFAYLFRGVEAQVFDLTFIHEHSQIEIAEILGVTGSRISQLMKSIRSRLRDELGIETVREKLEVTPELSELEVKWLEV